MTYSSFWAIDLNAAVSHSAAAKVTVPTVAGDDELPVLAVAHGRVELAANVLVRAVELGEARARVVAVGVVHA